MIRTSHRMAASGALLAWLAPALLAQTANMDAGLADFVRIHKEGGNPLAPRYVPGTPPAPDWSRLASGDAQGRVLVELVLNGQRTLGQIKETAAAAGAAIAGEAADYQSGLLSLYVPLPALETLARTPGVGSLTLSLKPVQNAGSVPSQGVPAMKADQVHLQGFDGTGLTVGVLSDSYDKSTFTSVRAANDIASGDLPVPKLVVEYAGTDPVTDEGRAMMQIVRDVAPGASQCFASAFGGLGVFAANIKRLRTDPACQADIIVDDVVYFSEPVFSEGIIAQTVTAVANTPTSTAMPGKRITYFSSAGNQQSRGFTANPAVFTPLTSAPGVDLNTIAGCPGSSAAKDTSGGFLDFGGGVYTATVSFAPFAPLMLQWDDPFDFSVSKISTDLNIILFQSGTCWYAFGADNFGTNQALEVLSLNGSATLTMMVARRGTGTKLAQRVKLIGFGGTTSSLFNNKAASVTFGHSAVLHAISVGAYVYSSDLLSQPPAFEPFSSPGPVLVTSDRFGNRHSPVTRKKPDISAPDGASNTFFGGVVAGTHRFYGTSAAAPHAAGVAALLMQKAGGPGSLPWQSVRHFLQSAVPPRIVPYGALPLYTGWNPYDGFGFINALASANLIVAGPGCGGAGILC